MTLLPQETTRPRFGLWWVLGTALSVGVALISLRYLAGVGPMPDEIVGNAFASPWLVVHVATAATALLVGSFQFLSRLRSRRPAWHRYAGRLYVASCLVGGVSGQVLAWGTTAGPVALAGFALLSLLWLGTTAEGFRRALSRDFVGHRQWMIRSWALTLAAVTLRIQLGIAGALALPFETSYPAIAFLCWVPNILVAELYLRRLPRPA